MLYTSKYAIEDFEVYELEETTSTNDELKSISNIKPNHLITAIKQTQGRGRRGRTWEALLGNLYFSYSFEIAPQELSRLVFIISLSIAQSISEISKEDLVKIKWPNDVLLNDKKVSGVLLENIKDNIWAIGIGVNIVSSPKLPSILYQATSLQEEGIMLDRKEFLHYYLTNFNKNYKTYKKEGFSKIKTQWLEYAKNYQQTINIKTEKETKTGIFSAIDDDGYLILQNTNKEEKIIAGDLFI
ncbi:MAG: biotin--[Alphaproteobacteria bacterium]|nr:biotin--[acetyl-CoA-carboxylase] ligase [Alphaproteobacteria bacterium]